MRKQVQSAPFKVCHSNVIVLLSRFKNISIIFTNDHSDLRLTPTNLIVHERFQALNEFMLVPLINTLLPAKKEKTNKKLNVNNSNTSHKDERRG